MKQLYKVELYVPESHLRKVKEAMFSIGAGQIGNYDCCCWETLGTGQFRPLTGSTPYTGQINTIEKEQEYKVELICSDNVLKETIEAMVTAHPYETPAYSYWKINNRL